MFENSEKRLYRVLVVDDDVIDRKIIGRLFKKYNVKSPIIEALNGIEAINCLKNILRDPNDNLEDLLIFMDISMPIMDGFTATKNIRNGSANDGYCNIPIIAMTANAMQGDREECINAGMNDYLTKPINKKLLADCLVRYFSNARK